MTNILTNKLDIEIFYENIYNDYKVVVRTFSKDDFKSFQQKALAVKKLKKDNKILAYLINGADFIYLLDKDDIIKDENSKILQLFEFKQISSYLLANMILKLLAHDEVLFDIETSFNKVLYTVKATKGLINTVEFYIDQNEFLSISSVSFKKFEPTKCSKKDLQKQTYIKEGNILISKDKNETKKVLYIQGNYGKKESVEYFNKNKKKYLFTKSYIAGLLFENIKKHLSKYIKINLSYFEMEVVSETFNHKYNYDNLNKKDLEIINIAKDTIKNLNIINTTDIEIAQILPYFTDILKNTKINILDKPLDNEFNLVFTYEKEYYEINNIKDVYQEIKHIAPYSQSCQLEIEKPFDKNKVNASIKELLIKNDIRNKKITLANESKIKAIYHIEKNKENNTVVIHKLLIENQNMQYSLLTSGEEYKSLLSSTYIKYGSISIIIEDFEGNVSAIVDTKMYAVIDYEGMLKYSRDGDKNNKSFSISKKEKSCYEFIKNIHGLKTFKLDNLQGYILGKYDNTSSYSKNSPARIIYPLKGKAINIDIITSSLQQYFIKNKDITVMPYQLKYLREIIGIKKILDN